MPEVYRKRGRVVRFEHDHIIRTTECGEAVEDGVTFRAAPLEEEVALPEVDEERVVAVARAIAMQVRPPLQLERLIVSAGIAEHEFGGVRWSEESWRVHASITHGGLRVLIDDERDVAAAVDALARAGEAREAPRRIVLAPNVSAALLPSLVGTDVVELWQTAAPHDGKGAPVREQRITGNDYPNWYRPSYRTRPVRMPFHLAARAASGAIDPALPRAVALLVPVAGNVLHVLCADGTAAAITVERVVAVGGEARWYPFAAGSFGADMLV